MKPKLSRHVAVTFECGHRVYLWLTDRYDPEPDMTGFCVKCTLTVEISRVESHKPAPPRAVRP